MARAGGLVAILLAVGLTTGAAGAPADVFRFDSGGACHIEGFGAWRVSVD